MDIKIKEGFKMENKIKITAENIEQFQEIEKEISPLPEKIRDDIEKAFKYTDRIHFVFNKNILIIIFIFLKKVLIQQMSIKRVLVFIIINMYLNTPVFLKKYHFTQLNDHN